MTFALIQVGLQGFRISLAVRKKTKSYLPPFPLLRFRSSPEYRLTSFLDPVGKQPVHALLRFIPLQRLSSAESTYSRVCLTR
jgi:hypothetical protein